jgi:hypothetical protein
MKPMLKAPGTKCLKLEGEKPRSSFGFNFKLRRYNLEGRLAAAQDMLASLQELDTEVRPGRYYHVM